MTTQEAKQVLDWIEEGKCEYDCGGWIPYPNNKLGIWSLNASEQFLEFRRKPEPKLRPWKPEEAIGKVVRGKDWAPTIFTMIVAASNDFVQVPYSNGGYRSVSVKEILDSYEQLDGSPCGVQE